MNEIELLERIDKWEDIHTEFKERIADRNELAKDIVCFANTDGGQLIIGVTENKDRIGIEDLDKLMQLVDDVAYNQCEPPVTVVQETLTSEDKTVLIVNIPKGAQRPYRTQSGQYYIRSTNRCRQASREELLRLFQAAESLYYDETAITRSSFTDIDSDFFMKFLNNYMDIDVEENVTENFLKNLHCLNSKRQPTVAGLLFFGKNPQKFLASKKIICAFIKGDDISVPPSDRKDISGKIPEILEYTQKFLKLYLTEEHHIEGFKPEVHFEIPEAALREGIVNAIAHRDYTIDAPIRVLIFKKRVEIRTPGKLPNTVTIDSIKIGGSHVVRNPSIYNLLSKMGMVTDLGSGVRRLIKLVEEHVQKQVEFQDSENEFIVSLPRKK